MATSRDSGQAIKFNRKTFRQFWAIAKLYFVSERKFQALGLLLLLATFSVSVSGINVVMSYIGRDFMTALSLKERDEFFRHLWRYLIAFCCATPLVVFYRFTEERLGLAWRQWLSLKILSQYFANRSYYRVNLEGAIDNPDQRIEEDIRSFTAMTLSFSLIVFNACINLYAFMKILVSISVSLSFIAVGYAALGSVVTYVLGRPLIGLNFEQRRKEADYRYKLINVRDNAESIAFLAGERKEETRVRQRLQKALDNLKSIISWNRNLGFFTTGYNYVVTILPTIVVAPLYLDGKIEFGVVTQAGLAFGQVLGALSIIVLNFGSISNLAAVISRLGTFWEGLLEYQRIAGEEEDRVKLTDGEALECRDVTVLTPRRSQEVIRHLDFALEPGKNLLIVGPSGSGKSSFLRAVAGLWRDGSGEIVRPAISGSEFLPQRPYMVLGTLRNQFLYGTTRKGITDRDIHEVVQQVHLAETIERVSGLDVTLDWATILSTGEQQRLAIARLLLSPARFAFLDEATTAISRSSEAHIYSLLRTALRSYVSVGDRERLERYHDYVLELEGGGKWSLEKIGGDHV